MTTTKQDDLPDDEASEASDFLTGVARAFAGAMIFSLPMLMTMEMWSLGFSMDPLRLALLMLLMVPLLVRMSRYGGIRQGRSLSGDIADALVAVAVAALACGLVLWLFGVVAPGQPLDEIAGKVALQTFPAAIGAMLARNQLGSRSADEDQQEAEASYGGELFLMAIGALFLSLNMSPTEEIVLIAYRMTPWQELVLLVLTLVLMHAFVYRLELRGSHSRPAGTGFFYVFAAYTIVGYAIVLLVSLYVLWTFGRTDGTALEDIVSMTVVLSFPGAIGASVARLIV